MVEKIKWCVCICVLPLALGADVLPEGFFDSEPQVRDDQVAPEDAKLTASASDLFDTELDDADEDSMSMGTEDDDEREFCLHDDADSYPDSDEEDMGLAFADDSLVQEPFYQGLVVPNTGRYKKRYPYRLVRDTDPNVSMALLDAPTVTAQRSLHKMMEEKKVVSFKGDLMRHGDTGECLVLHANLSDDITIIEHGTN